MGLGLLPAVLTVRGSERLGRLLTLYLRLDENDRARIRHYVAARHVLKSYKYRHWRFRGH